MKDKLIAVSITIGIFLLVCIFLKCNDTSSLTYEEQQANELDSIRESYNHPSSYMRHDPELGDRIGGSSNQEKIDSEYFLDMKKENPRAYKLHIKHTGWFPEECESVAKGEIWVGMSIQMVIAERGNPNHIEKSDYGDGVQYQACWYDYETSCFYYGSDGVVTSYN